MDAAKLVILIQPGSCWASSLGTVLLTLEVDLRYLNQSAILYTSDYETAWQPLSTTERGTTLAGPESFPHLKLQHRNMASILMEWDVPLVASSSGALTVCSFRLLMSVARRQRLDLILLVNTLVVCETDH